MTAQRGEPAKGEEACATPGCGHLRGAHLWPRHGGMECTKGDGCTKFTRPTEDAQRGGPAQSDGLRAEAVRLLYPLGEPIRLSHEDRERIDRVAAALVAAEQRGRESVGLGDFLPDPCGEEYSSYPWYIAETYGDYVTCTLRSGHDGKHEHSDSGMTWSTR